MTKYYLKHWSNARGRTSNPYIAAVEIDRIYVTADDRSSLGYIERRTTSAERGSDSYYDRHRRARGDTTTVTSDQITCTVPADALAKIVAAIAAVPGYEFVTETDDRGRFAVFQEFARGVNWVGPGSQQMRRRAAAFTVEI